MEPIEEPQLTPDLIRDRYDRLLARLRAAAEAAGRGADHLRVVGITKGFGTDVAKAATDAGLRRLGENRLQEALPKVGALPDVEWHLVGRLQSNKARAAVRAFDAIHSVDSLELLDRIERIAAEEGRRPQVLLQVNVTGEAAKGGFPLDWFAAQAGQGGELAAALRRLHAARPAGLMTMGPMGAGEEASRQAFARLRALRDELEQTSGVPLRELSMGMTADAEAAAAEGATLVRVGTALFGPRPE